MLGRVEFFGTNNSTGFELMIVLIFSSFFHENISILSHLWCSIAKTNLVIHLEIFLIKSIV